MKRISFGIASIVAVAVLVSSRTPAASAEEWAPGCQTFPDGVPQEHTDSSCDIAVQNDPVYGAQLNEYYRSLSPSQILSLPEEETVHCPMDDELRPSGGGLPQAASVAGHMTRWIVHNDASGPIVLSWLNEDGVEVSAHDGTTAPPEMDSEYWPDGAILEPGSYAVIKAFQGHTFYARELEVSDGGGLTSGRILMKHRAGLIHIKNDMGVSCDGFENADIATSPAPDAKEDKVMGCNYVPKGFVNQVGCPVDLYFATGGTMEATPKIFGADEGRPSCEGYVTHLGTNANPRDYLNDYSSMVKFEGVYNTHRFIARTSHNNALVSEIKINRHIVRDCPRERKSRHAGSSAAAQTVEILERTSQQVALDDLLDESSIGRNLTEMFFMADSNIGRRGFVVTS